MRRQESRGQQTERDLTLGKVSMEWQADVVLVDGVQRG